jgi:monomeric sarcosine oxidase
VANSHYEVIVLGGGTMGSAAGWALGRRGIRALVLEQFEHVHRLGSHGGQTRIFRHAYSEGAAYVPLMLRADDLWVELEQEVGLAFVHRTGILEMDAPGGDHARHARASAETHDLPYEWLNSNEIMRRWPAFRLPEGWEGGFSDRAGFLEVEPALRSMATSARRSGVEIREHTPVEGWGATSTGVWMDTAAGRVTADRLIITAGAWSSEALAGLNVPLTVVRKIVFWLDVGDPAPFRLGRLPVFAAATVESEIYGFPIFGRPGVKVANHLGGEPTTPETVDRTAHPGEAQDVLEWTPRFLPGLRDDVLDAVVCLYTRTPDEHFIIDRHPEMPNVTFAAGFSGHGFKFAPAIGEHLADLSSNPETQPHDLFRIDRFG